MCGWVGGGGGGGNFMFIVLTGVLVLISMLFLMVVFIKCAVFCYPVAPRVNFSEEIIEYF